MTEPSEEIEGRNSGGTVLKRICIVAMIVLVLLIVLTEFGVINYYSTQSSSSTEHQYETSRETFNGRAVLLKGFRLAPTVTARERSGSGGTVANAAAIVIRKASNPGAGAEGANFDITIDHVSISGTPWLPFYKNGSGTFTATYVLHATSTSGSKLRVQGRITGKTEQSIKGLSSTSFFHESMGKDIANAIIADIARMIAKNGA